jgi:hypothetical protein
MRDAWGAWSVHRERGPQLAAVVRAWALPPASRALTCSSLRAYSSVVERARLSCLSCAAWAAICCFCDAASFFRASSSERSWLFEARSFPASLSEGRMRCSMPARKLTGPTTQLAAFRPGSWADAYHCPMFADLRSNALTRPPHFYPPSTPGQVSSPLEPMASFLPLPRGLQGVSAADSSPRASRR